MTHQFRFALLAACCGTLFLGCPPPRATCGNGIVETGETCDDGNQVDGDSCSANCGAVTNTGGGGGAMTGGGNATGGGTVTGGGTAIGGGVNTGGGATGGGTTGGGLGGGGGSMPAVCGNGVTEGTEDCDDGNMDNTDACSNTCTFTMPSCGNGKREGAEICDDGNVVGGDGCEADCGAFTNTATVKGCPGINVRISASETCEATAGDANRLVTGVVLTDGVTYVGGQVLIDGASGAITCASCDCSSETIAAAATKLVCPKGIVSPGLINAHDHISYQASPGMRTAERYEHRHDWRVGGSGHDNHTRINNGGNATNTQIRWAELRQVMAGTTSIVGATYTANGNLGMLRNLDTSAAGQQGAVVPGSGVDSDTFPLGDTSGTELTSGCGYPSLPAAAPGTNAFLPHISEGIEASAHNEFVCLIQTNNGVLSSRTGIVHAIGLTTYDIALMSSTSTSLVWSPRSNVSLYGDTAAIPVYRRLGVNIAMGTDWTISGSMNLLRELRCADGLNSNYFGHALSDEELWKAVTSGGADATATSATIGRIAVGKLGDLAIYKRKPGSFYRSIIDAEAADVVVTMRGGKVLFADATVMPAFDTAGSCESFDVCGVRKAACVSSEFAALATGNAGNTLALLQTANASTYGLFYCPGMTIPNEPSCVPERSATSPVGSNSKNGSTIYTSASTDMDKDGIADATDNCPGVFNPARPMDNMQQQDVDSDGVGDACDVCPLNANVTTCAQFNPNDRDGDGVLNAADNCPSVANPAQADGDGDLKGDACDPCPMASNPGNAACPATIYAIKSGTSPLGQPVSLSNVLVSAVGTTGFFLQVPQSDPAFMGSDNSGLFVYQAAPAVLAGDRINIAAGTPVDYFGQIQLNGTYVLDAGLTILSRDGGLPTPIVVTPAAIAGDAGMARALESVLLTVQNVTVTDINPDAGSGDRAPTNEYVLNGALRVNDFLYLTTPFPTLNQPYLSITGVLEYRNNNYKLEPRSVSDILTGPPTLVGIEPATIFIREGSTTTLPTPALVRLSSGAIGDTAVTVTSGAANVTVGDGGLIIVANGQATSPVPLTGVTSTDGGTVTLTATSGALSRTAQVRVLGANDVPTLLALDPQAPTVNAGGTATFTVRTSIPVATDTAVTMIVMPNTVGTVPMTVTIPANASSITATVNVAATASGMGTITATLGASTVSTTLTVATVPTASDLIISEYGEGNSNNKYIEIFNGTAAPVDLSNYTLSTYANGNSAPTAQSPAVLTGLLDVGQAYVICQPSIAASLATNCDITHQTINFNGNDAVALKHASVIIDQIGVIGTDPGAAGWAVCGVAGGTVDHILNRKPSITTGTTAWTMSAGTSVTDCQWLVTGAATEAAMLMNNTMGTHAFGP